VNSIATRLLTIIPRVTLEEFYWQDSHYSTDSRLGRELLYLIANDEWIRTTTEVLDVSRSDAVETTIRFDLDLARIAHEAFRGKTGLIWLPVLTLTRGSPGTGRGEDGTFIVTDALGIDLSPVPQPDVRHWLSAALAEIIVNFASARLPVSAARGASAQRPTAGRDQRLLLGAALFRLLSEDTGDLPATTGPRKGRLATATSRLNGLLRSWLPGRTAGQETGSSPLADIAAGRITQIIDALTGTVVVVVGVDRPRSPVVLNVAVPARRLFLTHSYPDWLRWLGPLRVLGLLQPRGQLRLDLLLPSADADRQVQVQLPGEVSIDGKRTVLPGQGLWIQSGPLPAVSQLKSLVEQLRDKYPLDHAIRRALADLALVKVDALAEALRWHSVLPARVRSGSPDDLLAVTGDELDEATDVARYRLAALREALVAVTAGIGPEQEETNIRRLCSVRDGSDRPDTDLNPGDWITSPLLRRTVTGSPGPRRLDSRAVHTENVSQRVIPASARINVPVHVPDARFGSVARFSGLMSALLMLVVLIFFVLHGVASRGTSTTPSAEALASALSLFSVIQFGRIEVPDRSTLRGRLSFAGTALIAASLLPTIVLAILIAFAVTGWTPIVATVVLLALQCCFLIALTWGPIAPGSGSNARPVRVLSTGESTREGTERSAEESRGYSRAGLLRTEWWRSTTGSALVTGREAFAYVIWEHPDQSAEQRTEPSLHRLLGTAIRNGAQRGRAAALTTRWRAERTGRGFREPAQAAAPGPHMAEEAGQAGAAVTGPVLAQWPPNLLALLRSGTEREALTFLVFREKPRGWPPPGGIRVPIDPDRLPATGESRARVDIWVGVPRAFAALGEHALLATLDCAAANGLFVYDTQLPAPPPARGEPSRQCAWARFRIGLLDDETTQLGPFLRELRSRLAPHGSALRMLVRTSSQGFLREPPVCDPPPVSDPPPGGDPRRLVLASELDVVSMTGRSDGSWRVLAVCADAHAGLEHSILSTLADKLPGLQLAAFSHALLHGTTVLLMLCHQSGPHEDLRVADVLAEKLPGAGVTVAVDEWQTSAQLGQIGHDPLLRVRARSLDQPGMLLDVLDVLDALRPALRDALPEENDPYRGVWHALLTVAVGRAATARISVRLNVGTDRVRSWDDAEFGAIEREVRSLALQATAVREASGAIDAEKYVAPENTVITVGLIRSLPSLAHADNLVHSSD
jgi:hypothetical protein